MRVVSGWFKCITFIVHFISTIFTSGIRFWRLQALALKSFEPALSEMDFLIHLQLKLVCKYWCTTHNVLLQVGYSFSFSLVQMLELGHKEGWELKYWCFWIVVLEKSLKGPLDCEDIKPVNPKGTQPWIFIGRTDAEAEAPILSPPDVKNQLIGKDPDAGKDWRQENGATEDEMVRWPHRHYGHEFEQTLGDSEGERTQAFCRPWGLKKLDMT